MVSLDEQANASELRNDLLEQFQPLAGQLRRKEGHTGRVLARSREARYEVIANRVGDRRHDERSRLVELANSDDCFRAVRNNHVHIQLEQLLGQIGQSFSPPGSPSIYQDEILTLDVTELLQSVLKSVDGGRWSTRQCEKPNPSKFCGLLRPRRERPRGCCATEQADEVAPIYHSMTSSASASKVEGTSRPSALAALRLMTDANLVAC